MPARHESHPGLKLGAAVATVVLLVAGGLLVRGQSGPSGTDSAEGRGEPELTIADRDTTADNINSLRAELDANADRQRQLMLDNQALEQEAIERSEDHARELARLEGMLNQSLEGIGPGEEGRSAAVRLQEQIAEIAGSVRNEVGSLAERLDGLESGGGRETIDGSGGRFQIMDRGRDYTAGDTVSSIEHLDMVFLDSLDGEMVVSADQSLGGGGPLSGAQGVLSGDILRRNTSPGAGAGRAGTPPVVRSAPLPVLDPQPERFYTLPDNSILAGATAATALFGKIYPVGEDVVNPRNIKVVVGRENIAANNTPLPMEIDKMIFSGYAVGEPAGACVTGNLTAATFVFRDGTIKNAYIGDPGSRPDNEAYAGDRIGYITDNWGNDCIPGQFITNAPRQLAALTAIGALTGYAEGYRQGQVTTEVVRGGDGNGDTIVENVTGSRSDFAVANGVSAGLDETADYFRQRYGNFSEAYYVPNGAGVVVNLEQEIRLDKDVDARLVRYQRSDLRRTRLD